MEIYSEHSDYKIDYMTNPLDSKQVASAIISIETKNSMSDDAGAMVIVLAGDFAFDKTISPNDIIVLHINPNTVVNDNGKSFGIAPVTNDVVMTGLVSEIRVNGDYGSNSKMYQITAQTFAKMFIQYKVGMMYQISESLADLGWLWDASLPKNTEISGNKDNK